MSGAADVSYYSIIPWQVLSSQRLSDKTKLVYGLIASLAKSEGYCWASNTELAAIMTCGERTISRAICELCAAGELVVKEVGATDRRGNRERRMYTRETAVRCTEAASPNLARLAKTGEASLAKSGEALNKVDNLSPIKPPITPRGGEAESELFARFWALYPRKVNKKAALKAWHRLNPSKELCRKMSGALKRQIASDEWRRENGRYIPYPATWLNGARWEDEIDVSPSGTPEQTARFGVWE